MKLPQPLAQGQLLKRYKRFFADIELDDGQVITAHLANTGSLKGCLEKGSLCVFSTHDDPKRKLKHSLHLIQTPGGWVGVNTSFPNILVRELFESSPLPHWQNFAHCQSEVKINPQSRIDLKLWPEAGAQDLPAHFIEVKNVTLAENGVALFPDAVTLRGQKHLLELMNLLDQGHSAELVFVVQREDCHSFAPADSIDPEYGRLLRQAQQKGVRLTALPFEFDGQEIQLKAQELTNRT